ncbi:ATP-binding protein [Streptomyces sp. NPDC091268]|uniref:ATP-binding protein n=1 Tax=Streptomyces sp. NPDC091268 TaxID=3365979 RepID=UPI0038193983
MKTLTPDNSDYSPGRDPGAGGAARSAPPPATAAAARERVSALLRGAGIGLDSVSAADALLVTTELVINAIQHGGGLTGFRIDVTDDFFHLSIDDRNPRAPTVSGGGASRDGGFGWKLVQRLTHDIDITTRPHGKTITTTLLLI